MLRGTIIPVQPSKPCELTELIILSLSNPISFIYIDVVIIDEYSSDLYKETFPEMNRLQINSLMRYGKSLRDKVTFVSCLKQSLIYV